MEADKVNIQEMIFWGATGQAKVLRECLKELKIKLVGLFDNNNKLLSPFSDVPLFFGTTSFENWKNSRKDPTPVGFLVAIGGDKGRDRIAIQEYLERHGLIPLVAKHPTAFIAYNATIGVGSQIMANAAICVETVIGRGCIINTGAIVDHEGFIGDGVHIGPGAHLAGCVHVEKYATVYTGAVVLPKIKIGEGAIVGAGSVVIKDVPSNTVVFGNPAKPIKKLKTIYE